MVFLKVQEGTVKILDGAFTDRTDITEVHLPDTVKHIGRYAFNGCEKIVFIRLSKGLQSIGDNAFEGCSALTNLVLPDGLESIRDNAFRNCSGIVGLHFPKGLQSLGNMAFLGCSGIVDLHLPDALQSIGIATFEDCVGIISLRLPGSLQSIRVYAFAGCSSIVELYLPDTLQSIEGRAFARCSGIVDLYIPDTVRYIGQGNHNNHSKFSNGAFHGCTSLSRVLAPDALVQGELADPTKVFAGCPVLATGLTPYSRPRGFFWHPTVSSLCTSNQRKIVMTLLIVKIRMDILEGKRRDRNRNTAEETGIVRSSSVISRMGRIVRSSAVVSRRSQFSPKSVIARSLPIELWLLILQHTPICKLGC